MAQLIKTALTIGFTVLVQRAVTGYFDQRADQRALAKAAKTGFGSNAR